VIDARPIDGDSVNALIALAVRPDQIRQVAPNSVTIAQAAYQPGSWLRGLPVGLLALIDLDDPGVKLDPGDPRNAAYVWRLMVDQYHQRRGFGRQAIAIAAETARSWNKAQLVLSAVPTGKSAVSFYEHLGLRKTGRMVEDEVEMVMPLAGIVSDQRRQFPSP
jgi:diamine N-acetyltransferase